MVSSDSSRLGAKARETAPITLILTVLNESGSLPEFLRSLTSQVLKPSEIVITDGGSTDDTLQLLESWKPPFGVALKVIQDPGANISEGRNKAIENAQYERIAVADAGTTLDPLWLSELFNELDGGADVASGFYRPVGSSFIELTIASVISQHISEVSAETFLPSSRSVAFTKSAWRSVGGYPTQLDYCEDLVFDLRLRNAGMRFVFTPKATVTWSGRKTLSSFSKQYYRYARGDGKANLWPKRHLVRYSSYFLGLLLLGVTILNPLVSVIWTILALAYFSKFFRRVLLQRSQLNARTAFALLLTPAIVVIGDLSKMCGYPPGVVWRIANPLLAKKLSHHAD